MYLKSLSLTNFRNFARLDLELPDGPLLIVGANGQGKTSLLEAIYYLATFTSFHATHDRELVNFVAAREPLAVGRIVAHYQRDGSQHKLEIRIIKETNGLNGSTRVRKEILLDGLKIKAGEAVGQQSAPLNGGEEADPLLNLLPRSVLREFPDGLHGQFLRRHGDTLDPTPSVNP